MNTQSRTIRTAKIIGFYSLPSPHLAEVWHIVVPEAPSANATWDKFLIDLNDLYPADPEDSATDEELAHAGVRLR